jgi:hypothetical protein
MKKMMMLLVMAGAVTACSGRNVVAVRTAPRMPRPVSVGVMGVAPGPGYVWINGYQDWRGNRYVWVPGRWVRPPRANAVWVPGRFTTRGRSQVWVGGYWR